jgi:hypothetical protein
MITTEELNLEGKWWLPDRDNEIRIGNLTLNQLHKHGVLSIYGSFSGTREAAIILGELSDGQKVTLNKCIVDRRYTYFTNSEKSSITARNILLGGHFKTPEDIVFSSIQVTYYGEQINKWMNRFEIRRLFRSDKTENYIKYISRPSVK